MLGEKPQLGRLLVISGSNVPHRKRCPVCQAKVVKSMFGARKWLCESSKNNEGTQNVHYWYQYPVEIIRYGCLDFYIHYKDKQTYIIEVLRNNKRVNNHLPTRPLYTCEECIDFSRKWEKLAVLA